MKNNKKELKLFKNEFKTSFLAILGLTSRFSFSFSFLKEKKFPFSFSFSFLKKYTSRFSFSFSFSNFFTSRFSFSVLKNREFNLCISVMLLIIKFTIALYDSSDDVVELTFENFDSLVTPSGQPWIIEFYASWCE